jgi:HEAT repeat protein
MTSQMEDWLAGGDLRSDGASNDVADLVKSQTDLLPDLLACLEALDPVVRGRAADALEKVARDHPEVIQPRLDWLLGTCLRDDVPMVRWHLAMLLGHLSPDAQLRPKIREALFELLDDDSVFVASWAIASLCLVAYLDPGEAEDVVRAIGRLQTSPSAALRTRARKAVKGLTEPGASIPMEWVKSERVRARLFPSSSPPAE